MIAKHSYHKSIVRYYVKLISPPCPDTMGLFPPNIVGHGGVASFIFSAEIVIYANGPLLPQIGNAEVLNLENREVTSEQREQYPGGQ